MDIACVSNVTNPRVNDTGGFAEIALKWRATNEILETSFTRPKVWDGVVCVILPVHDSSTAVFHF